MIDFTGRDKRLFGNAVILYGFFAILIGSLQLHREVRYSVSAADWPNVAATVVPTNRYIRCGRLRWDCAEYRIIYAFDGVSHEAIGALARNSESRPLTVKVDPGQPSRFLIDPSVERRRSVLDLVMMAGALAAIFLGSRLSRKDGAEIREGRNAASGRL